MSTAMIISYHAVNRTSLTPMAMWTEKTTKVDTPNEQWNELVKLNQKRTRKFLRSWSFRDRIYNFASEVFAQASRQEISEFALPRMLIGGSVIILACLDTNIKDYQGSSLILLHFASLLLLRAKYNLDAYSLDKN